MSKLIHFILIVCLSAPLFAAADVITPPTELNRWKAWLLDKHPKINCAPMGVKAESRRCAWPGTLTINVSASGADFTQDWDVYGESSLILPGNQQHWPSNVKKNTKAAAVLERNNLPVLWAKTGKHHVSGHFKWQERPQFLQMPTASGLIKVRIDGKLLTQPNIDKKGRLWFKRVNNDAAEAKKGDSVKVDVFRRINDGIPITMDTVLRLAVSGKPRELLMGRLLLEDSELTQFDSALPARIEPDGSLRIQVRAGTWAVKLSARFTHNISPLSMVQTTPDWPDQEIWSFSPAPVLRGVKIAGVKALDPSLLNLPENWHNLPTYLLTTEDTFTLEELYRGNVAPSANQINTTRTLWLDFNGKGATVKDKLTGVIYQDWRLSVQPTLQLGRVSVDGSPQLVTRMNKQSSDGVEIRQPKLNLEAISRVPDSTHLTATGWQHDVDTLSMTVNLPPGWQLWHATGPDSINSSWLSQWDLWNLFLCLLIVGATFRLLGWPWAVLAMLTLGLTYHESNAPIIAWVVLIITLPLLQVLPQSLLRKSIANIGYLTLLSLVITTLTFSVQQIRQGLHPQLEQQGSINTAQYSYNNNRQKYDHTKPSELQEAEREEVVVTGSKRQQERISGLMSNAATLSQSPPSPKTKIKPQQKRYQPDANTQTGPGEPTWSWNSVRLGWSGPVTADAPLKLYLSPPWLTRLLMFVQVLLLAALVFGFARRLLGQAKYKPDNNHPSSSSAATTAAFGLVLTFALAGLTPEKAIAEVFPPEYLLKEWEQRLTKGPTCAPHCLAINAMQVTIAGKAIQLRIRVGVGTDLGVALPYDKSWQIDRVLVDGSVNDNLAWEKNRLWIRLPKGNHEIHIEGQVGSDNITIPFQQNPHNIMVSAEGWDVFGLVDNRVPSKSLQLQKREKAITKNALLPDPIAPFVNVRRHLNMDLDWHISTTIVRTAPQQGGISVNIPLLEGESVISEDIKIITQSGKRFVAVTFAAREQAVSWQSVIEPIPQSTWVATHSPLFVESWSVQASPRWHIRYEGLIPVKNNNNGNNAISRWLPWPGEQLQIHAVKPQPVAGPTTTVESASVNTTPGARSTELELLLKIRTSLGGDFRIEQPANATLERIEIDGEEVTQQQQDNTVILPLHPGLQSAKINWSLATGIGITTRTPIITLSSPASNIDLSMTFPRSRWPLLVNGPDIGPAMLYWGVLIVILFVAIALGRLVKQFTLNIPVNTWQWLLLAIGMSTVNMVGSIPVVLWFFALEARTRLTLPEQRWKFNLMQVSIAVLTVVAIICLFITIPQSLLSTPDMQVTGNGSYNYLYNWYQDHSTTLLPQGYVYSVPIWVYRIAMLAWSLWLVFALLRWAKWSWACVSKDKLWAAKPET